MAEAQRPYNVLFLCTGNSARSIIAEAVLRHEGAGRFNAFSAGSHPTGTVHPFALDLLRENGVPVAGLESKSWERFAQADAPSLDFVITVCDNAAGEVCPVWPGRPVTAHWGVADPAAMQGSEQERRRAFAAAAHVLTHRIRLLTSLPFSTLDRMARAARLAEIGRSS